MPERRRGFEDHPVLVQLREHGRDLALAERVVQRVVDHLRGDAEPRRGVAIDVQPRLETAVLLIARDVAQHRQRLQLRQKARHPGGQLAGVGVFEAVLKLRPADAIVDRDVLHRLHEQRDAFDLGQRRLQPPNHVARAQIAARRAASG